MLDFQVSNDSNNFIDLQKKLFLEIECEISRNNDGHLRTGTDAANTDAPHLTNNAQHFLFPKCTVSNNCVNIFNRNGNYAHKAFIGTKFSTGKTAKKIMVSLSGI